MILETERCIVRPWTVQDIDDAHAWLADPQVFARFVDPSAVCRTREDTARTVRASMDRHAKTGWAIWAVERREDARVIGRAGIKPRDGGWMRFDPAKAARGDYAMELGYAYARDTWGQGIATEVGRALVDWGFRVKKLARIVGVCTAENVASRRVLEKSGLIFHSRSPAENGVIIDFLAQNADLYISREASSPESASDRSR